MLNLQRFTLRTEFVTCNVSLQTNRTRLEIRDAWFTISTRGKLKMVMFIMQGFIFYFNVLQMLF